jgi:hypothetical protein
MEQHGARRTTQGGKTSHLVPHAKKLNLNKRYQVLKHG